MSEFAKGTMHIHKCTISIKLGRANQYNVNGKHVEKAVVD